MADTEPAAQPAAKTSRAGRNLPAAIAVGAFLGFGIIAILIWVPYVWIGVVAFKTRSPSLSLAAGYDWRLGGLTVTPTLTAITSTGGRLNSDRTGNAITDNARLGLLRSAVAFSWFR